MGIASILSDPPIVSQVIECTRFTLEHCFMQPSILGVQRAVQLMELAPVPFLDLHMQTSSTMNNSAAKRFQT